MTKIAEACGADRIAVGHTADDQAETVLLWVFRGAGLTGLSGMPACRNNLIIRPLYETRPRDILAYLHEEGVPFRQDSSNGKSVYLRNRIRHEIIPALQRVVPSPVEMLCRLADICGEDDPGPSEPTAVRQPAKAGRRKKTRRDPQMDLFGSAAAAGEDLDRPAVVAMDKEVVEAWPVEPESETLAVPEPIREIEPAAEEEIASPAEAKEVKDFPEVKGLSVSEGMAWADGNPRLFLKALREFAQQHAGTGDKIRAALEQGAGRVAGGD